MLTLQHGIYNLFHIHMGNMQSPKNLCYHRKCTSTAANNGLRDKITVLCMLMTAQILLSKVNILLYDKIQTHNNK
jgi:hypothetical protein